MIYLRSDILMAIAVAACLGAAFAAALSAWWWGKRHDGVAKRLQRSEAAHHMTGQQLLQARKQLQDLKLEAAVKPKAATAGSTAQPPRKTMEQAMADRARLEAELARKDLGDDLVARRSPSDHGFADTQVIASVG